jgi:hypothetical protein
MGGKMFKVLVHSRFQTKWIGGDRSRGNTLHEVLRRTTILVRPDDVQIPDSVRAVMQLLLGRLIAQQNRAIVFNHDDGPLRFAPEGGA